MSPMAQGSVQRVDADLYLEVQQFYARQMPLLEARRLEEFIETFTEDGWLEHRPNGWRLEGRDTILAEMRARRGDAERPRSVQTSPRRAREENIPYYDGLVYRYWFNRLDVQPLDEDRLRVTYLAVMSMTDRRGRVAFEPTTTVEDVLVRCDGRLLTRSRVVTHDTPAWADNIHNPDDPEA